MFALFSARGPKRSENLECKNRHELMEDCKKGPGTLVVSGSEITPGSTLFNHGCFHGYN